MDGVLKEQVYDAALAELVARGVDGFGVDGVARRAGLDPG